jgi:hypothetical protein
LDRFSSRRLMVEMGVLSTLKGGSSSGPQGVIIILLITSLVCYVSELLFVVPLLLVWPWLRQPPAWTGAL